MSLRGLFTVKWGGGEQYQLAEAPERLHGKAGMA